METVYILISQRKIEKNVCENNKSKIYSQDQPPSKRMIAVSGPIELSTTSDLGTDRWTCERCGYHAKWAHIASYNLYMGLLFPGLWLVNMVLALMFWILKDGLCSSQLHEAVDSFWLRTLGHSACRVAIYVTIGMGLVCIYSL